MTGDNTVFASMLSSAVNTDIPACDKQIQGSSDAKKLDASVKM